MVVDRDTFFLTRSRDNAPIRDKDVSRTYMCLYSALSGSAVLAFLEFWQLGESFLSQDSYFPPQPLELAQFAGCMLEVALWDRDSFALLPSGAKRAQVTFDLILSVPADGTCNR